jgi:hypothetical protein
MTAVAKRNSAAIAPASKQPPQLELFRLVSDAAYTNAFDFYEALPRFMVARGNTDAVTWNADGTAAPLRREFTYKDKRYKFTIAPAYIEKPGGQLRAEFPGVKEELLELVLMKLAVDKGYFTAARGDGPAQDSFVLFTSIHQISEELKRRGKKTAKSKSYSYAQIREGLQVLAKTKMHLRSETDDHDLVFSPIAEMGYFSDKAVRDGITGTVYIRFNTLITQAILARSWRQINYNRLMDTDAYLRRWLTKRLSLRFSYASPNKSYNIKLSSIIEGSGISLYDRLSDNLKLVERTLGQMTDIVQRYHVEKQFVRNEHAGKGRKLADAKIVLRPTNAFVVEQLKTNVHENRLDTAVETLDGKVLIEPRRDAYPSLADYERARHAHHTGHAIAPPAKTAPDGTT